MPWKLDGIARAGELRLPEARMAGGDAVSSGGVEGLEWTIDLPAGSYAVHVVFVRHAVEGRACAALELRVDESPEPEEWKLVRTRFGRAGYHPEVGLASFGAPSAYDAGVVHRLTDEVFAETTSYGSVDGGEHGTIVFCGVHDQHPLCRTWVGKRAGRPVAVVTDLGKLGLDLAVDSRRPWVQGIETPCSTTGPSV